MSEYINNIVCAWLKQTDFVSGFAKYFARHPSKAPETTMKQFHGVLFQFRFEFMSDCHRTIHVSVFLSIFMAER
jgi:hypothetical protein